MRDKKIQHNLLNTQMANLGLSEDTLPTLETWQMLLKYVDRTYARAEMANRYAKQTVDQLIERIRTQTEAINQRSDVEDELMEAQILNRIIGAITSTLKPDEILQILCTELAHFLKLPYTSFAKVEEKNQQYRIVAEFSIDQRNGSRIGELLDMEGERPKNLFQGSDEEIFVANDFIEEDDQGLRRQLETISMLIIPIHIGTKRIGVLGLHAFRPRRFTPREVSMIHKVAAVAGQSLHKAQLYEDLKSELAQKEVTETALEQARDEAMEASRIKSQLIAKVSHELRTPLNSIMGFAEMLQLGVFGPLDTNQTDILNKVLLSTEYLVLQVNDLLDMAQIEAGKLKLESGYFSPSDLLDRVETSMSQTATQKGLNLFMTLDPRLPELIWGDIDRIYQIMINLVDNAIKFTERGSVRVDIQLNEPNRLILLVKDTGIGIPANQHQAIFEQFQQSTISVPLKRRGIGLGLSIVSQLVDMMQGEIELESQVNQGSTFRILLPLKAPPTYIEMGSERQTRTSA
ncbi:MAG: ATP-binding protein [Chloroflexota bacterium]